MASSITPTSQSQFPSKAQFSILKQPPAQFLSMPISIFSGKKARMVVISATAAAEKHKKGYPGEAKGFVEEMRFVAMKLHTRDQAKEGEKEPEGQPVAKWDPTIEGYLRFLVDSKYAYETLEKVVERASFPEYVEFRKTGLERSECLAKDLNGLGCKAILYQNHPPQVLLMLSILKNYQKKILRHSFVISTTHTLLTLLVAG